MRKLFIVLGVLSLAACTPAQIRQYESDHSPAIVHIGGIGKSTDNLTLDIIDNALAACENAHMHHCHAELESDGYSIGVYGEK